MRTILHNCCDITPVVTHDTMRSHSICRRTGSQKPKVINKDRLLYRIYQKPANNNIIFYHFHTKLSLYRYLFYAVHFRSKEAFDNYLWIGSLTKWNVLRNFYFHTTYKYIVRSYSCTWGVLYIIKYIIVNLHVSSFAIATFA